jgi:hypothetical protein
LRLKEKIFELTSNETSEVKWLIEETGSHRLISSPLHESGATVIAGVPLGSIESIEIRRLLEELVKREAGLSKEELYVFTWGGSYDPVIHDPKIYKFIMRLRRTFSRQDIVINRYGRYVLNPSLRGWE